MILSLVLAVPFLLVYVEADVEHMLPDNEPGYACFLQILDDYECKNNALQVASSQAEENLNRMLVDYEIGEVWRGQLLERARQVPELVENEKAAALMNFMESFHLTMKEQRKYFKALLRLVRCIQSSNTTAFVPSPSQRKVLDDLKKIEIRLDDQVELCGINARLEARKVDRDLYENPALKAVLLAHDKSLNQLKGVIFAFNDELDASPLGEYV